MEYQKEKTEGIKGQKILLKYGGNAMIADDLKKHVIDKIIELKKLGAIPIIVHGGGPFIKKLLDMAQIKSEFFGGHRKTEKDAMAYVEMALKGQVNSDIVKLINRAGLKAVGLSGKDGGMVTATKRFYEMETNGKKESVDLGHVGDVAKVDTSLIELLIMEGYIPVIAPIGVGEDGEDYNINADMFAGHLAGALKVDHYLALTDVDGLRTDKDDPATLIHEISAERAEKEIGKIIQGGMIPKIESCLIALNKGVKSAYIINGTKNNVITDILLTDKGVGTKVTP